MTVPIEVDEPQDDETVEPSPRADEDHSVGVMRADDDPLED